MRIQAESGFHKRDREQPMAANEGIGGRNSKQNNEPRIAADKRVLRDVYAGVDC
jgi:hypothetical protein